MNPINPRSMETIANAILTPTHLGMYRGRLSSDSIFDMTGYPIYDYDM